MVKSGKCRISLVICHIWGGINGNDFRYQLGEIALCSPFSLTYFQTFLRISKHFHTPFFSVFISFLITFEFSYYTTNFFKPNNSS